MTSSVPAAGTDPSSARLPSLTGLRWVAAMLVFGFHVGTMGFIADRDHQAVVSWLFSLGLSGVEFFFILSGFVLVWSARPGEGRWAFWRRRLAKIYPNHLLMWAVVLLVAFWSAAPVDPLVALSNLLLVQAWSPTPGWFYSVNDVSWSLSCELFFYLCLPFALPVLHRTRSRVLWAVVVAVPLLILALWPAQLLVPEESRWWFTQVFPPVRSLEFWMGVAAAELMRRGHWRGPGLPVASALFVLVWVVSAGWIRAELWAALLSAAYLLVITAAARADVRGLPSPWRSRPMVRLGEISFAFYLVHVFVMRTVLRLTDRTAGLPGWWGPLAAVGFLALNVLLAWLLWRWVETPAMRRLARPRRRPAASASPPAAAPSASSPAPAEPASPPVSAWPPAPRAAGDDREYAGRERR